MVSRDETFLAPVHAGTDLDGDLPEDTPLLVTVQSPDLQSALDLAGPRLATHPVVTWQNGVRAEPAARPRCPRLYGGVVRFTSTVLIPGEVRLRGPGQLIVGLYPFGTDALAEAMAQDFRAAGFQSAVSPDIRVDKALKLLVNLVSGPAVLVHRTEADPGLARVQLAVLEEAVAAYAAAGVRAEPLSGLGQTPEALMAGFRAGGSAPDTSGGVYNSTWQNLHHKRPRIENAYYHGEIIHLAQEHGTPAAVNQRVLELLQDAQERSLGPEPYSPEAFRARFEDLLTFPGPDEDAAGAGTPPGLEI